MSDQLRDDVRAALAMSDAELAEAQQAASIAEASTSLDADTLAALAISETDVWHHTVDVADANSLQELATDYKSGARADLYMAKLNDLRRLYERMHRVRGDGNCFYRALWVGWMQRLLSLPDAECAINNDSLAFILASAQASVLLFFMLALLLVVMLASGVAELLSLGAVLPFLAVLSEPQRLPRPRPPNKRLRALTLQHVTNASM